MGKKSKEEMWKSTICEMRESGKSQKKWCEENDVNYFTLKYWIQKLSAKVEPLADESNDKETTWIKVEEKVEDIITPQNTDKIEICIGSFRVVVPENFSKESMTSVMEVLAKIC